MQPFMTRCPHCDNETPARGWHCINCGAAMSRWAWISGWIPHPIRKASTGTTRHLSQMLKKELSFWQFYLPSWILSLIGGILYYVFFPHGPYSSSTLLTIGWVGTGASMLGQVIMFIRYPDSFSRLLKWTTINSVAIGPSLAKLAVLILWHYFR